MRLEIVSLPLSIMHREVILSIIHGHHKGDPITDFLDIQQRISMVSSKKSVVTVVTMLITEIGLISERV